MTNIHTHGLHLSPEGMQDNILQIIKPKENKTYVYKIPEDHPSGTCWYHPHHHGAVNAQLTGLIAGALIVQDRNDDFPSELAAMEDNVFLIEGLCFTGCDIQ